MTDVANITRVLEQTAIFSDLGRETLDAIASVTERRRFDEGDTVYQFADDAREIFVVERGRIRFTMGVGNRPGFAGSIMTDGQVFGWAGLVEDQPRRVATAVCLEPSILLAIDGERILAIFEHDTSAGYAVMRRLAAMIAHNFVEVLTS